MAQLTFTQWLYKYQDELDEAGVPDSALWAHYQKYLESAL